MSDPRVEAFARLLEIVDRLRAPDGCPWDREQTLPSMASCVLEEAYEVVDALLGEDDRARCGEIGDLLMNCALLARIAEDEGRFSMREVAERVSDKLVRRHPHVFGQASAGSEQEALANWERVKRAEREADGRERSALEGVPTALPALLRAYRVGQKAAQTGFDWPDRTGPLAKLHEELGELESEIEADSGEQRLREELGDVLFSACNLARHLGIEPETALRDTVERFSERFRGVERRLGDRLGEADLDELERAWQAAKRDEAR